MLKKFKRPVPEDIQRYALEIQMFEGISDERMEHIVDTFMESGFLEELEEIKHIAKTQNKDFGQAMDEYYGWDFGNGKRDKMI